MPRRLEVVVESPLPPLYAAWMEELLSGPIPNETEATCDSCAMLTPDAPHRSFDASTKCCTYLPEMPSFLVGRVLRDRDRSPAARHGRASIEKRIDERIAVTPLGLGMPAPYKLLYDHASKHEGFGRTPQLRCTHYVEDTGGQCGVWNHRMNVCATWFCKHVRGARGMDFWRHGMQPLLSEIEKALARHCLLELDVGEEALARLMHVVHRLEASNPAGGQLVADPDVHRRDWGPWLGRERAFYIECADIVGALAWKDVLRIGGSAVRARAEVARTLHVRLVSGNVPDSLRPGQVQVIDVDGESARLSSYSTYDAVDVPAALLPLLGRFDGRPTKAVVAELGADEGIELDDETIAKLVDFEILIAEAPSRRGPALP